jgi:hypothetical protein
VSLVVKLGRSFTVGHRREASDVALRTEIVILLHTVRSRLVWSIDRESGHGSFVSLQYNCSSTHPTVFLVSLDQHAVIYTNVSRTSIEGQCRRNRSLLPNSQAIILARPICTSDAFDFTVLILSRREVVVKLDALIMY